MNNAQRAVVLFFLLLLAPVCFYVGGASGAWRWLQGEAFAWLVMRLIRVVLPVVCVAVGLYVWAGWDDTERRPSPWVLLPGPVLTLVLAGFVATLLGALLLWIRS